MRITRFCFRENKRFSLVFNCYIKNDLNKKFLFRTPNISWHQQKAIPRTSVKYYAKLQIGRFG